MTLLENAQEIQSHPDDFGQKTIRLIPLSSEPSGLPVYGVSCETLGKLFSTQLDDSHLEELAETIEKRVGLPCIIRSSGMLEDGDIAAHAGRFKSCTAHTRAEIVPALTAVLTDARAKVRTMSEFSLLIQPYIVPTYTGVLFTRDPRGSLLSTIAWAQGDTPHVVSGGKSTECLFHRRHPERLPFEWMRPLVEAGLRIESTLRKPQDIEWVYDGTRFFIVQTRPITTLPLNTYESMRMAEDTIEQDSFYFDSSGVAENYPHPTPLTYSLLTHLYNSGGSIANVYASYGIQTTSALPFRLIGERLYTDKEIELKTFFPSHSYFRKNKLQMHWASWAGILTTYTNSVALQKIRWDSATQERLYEQLTQALRESESIAVDSVEALLAYITRVYVPVFETNLLAAYAESNAQKICKDEKKVLVELLTTVPSTRHYETPHVLPIGNSLAIEDDSPFVSVQSPQEAAGTDVLSPEKIDALSGLKRMLQLREYGRIVSAWCAHHTRAYATERVVAHGLSKSDAPFITLDELRRGTIPTHLVRDRKDVYEKASSNLPSVLSTLPLEEQGDVRVISQGKARGWVVDETHLLHAEPTKDYILFTDTLRPDLVRHFPRIKAIITRAGSTLSHLAIVARESHIPVVVDPHCAVLTDGTYMMDIDTSTVLSPHK